MKFSAPSNPSRSTPMSTRTLWKIKVDVHQVYNLRLGDSTELPDPYIAATLILPHTLDSNGSAPTQRTAAKSKMSTGNFNAVMLFVANVYDFNFDRIKISIRVHNSKKYTELLESDGAVIGSTTFSLTSIYEQTNHWLPREWLPITNPASPGDCRGYIQVSLGVFGPGDDVPIQLSDFQLSSIGAGGKDSMSRALVEKIVQTPETNFHNSMLIFNVHRAEHLPILQTSSGLMAPSSGYVRVSFVGIQSLTRVIGSNANPAWNESVRIPVLFPSWDKYVIVEVFSSSTGGSGNSAAASAKQPSAESASSISSSDILLGTAIFDFDLLYRQGIQATWFNMYRSPSAVNPGFGSLHGPEYSGRVQVSATVARSSDLNASVVPFDITTINEPPTEEIVLFVDIYELDFMDEAITPDEIPQQTWIHVQFGPNSFESTRISNCGMTCIFEGDDLGRFVPIRLHLPLDRSMAFDMILSIYGQNYGEEKRRICFARIGIDRFLVMAQSGGVVPQVDPEWIQLSRIVRGKGTATTLSGVVENMADTVTSGFTFISDGIADIANSFFGGSASPSRPTFRRADTSGIGQKRIEDSLVRVSNVLACIMAVKTSVANKPRKSAADSTASASGGASTDVSAFITSDITAEMIIKRRPPRIVYEMKPYELRFCAHQACNLPITDKRNLTSAFCRVTLAGVSTRTSIVPTTLYPIWNEALKIEVDLPQNASIRPDVNIEVVHMTDLNEEIVLGVTSMKTVSLKPMLTGPPIWYKLHSPNQSLAVEQESHVLCSAVLVPANDSMKYAVPSPLPVRSTFTADLLILGVRLVRNYSIEHLNKIELSWGRHRANQRKKVITVRTADPVSGEGGQFNFLQPVMLDLDLPIDSIFQEFLEVRLFELLPEPNAEETIGYGFIHLNPHYAWLSDQEKAQYRNLFRMKTHEEIRREEEIRALEAAKKQQRNRGGFDQVKVETRRRRDELSKMKNMERDKVELAYMENEIDGLYGLDTKDNFISLPLQYFNSVETDALFPSRFKVRSAAARRPGGGDENKDYGDYDVSAAGRSARDEEEIGIRRLNPKFLSDFVWEPTVSKESQENTRKIIEGDLESSDMIQNFATSLPFIFVPIVIGSPIGTESFVVVGYLKVRVLVHEKSASSNELMSLKQEFTDQYERSKKLMCRLYALRAEGIVPSSTSAGSGGTAGSIVQDSTTSYFLWVRNVSGDLVAEYPTCSIKDDGALTIEGGVNPEFNKCFQLPVSLPENALLYIELYERVQTAAVISTAAAATGIGNLVGGSTDTLIGTVVIDLENRWFCQKYKQLVGSGEIPIETLTLRSADSSGIPKGKLKLWVELMDQVTSMGRPIEILPSPQPEFMEVRIALWRTRGVPNAEGEDQCNQGVIVFMQNLESQSTDTHYGSVDGTGTFNWRFVFNPTVPTEDGSIRFQLHHRPLVALSNVPIGEVSIDISHELAVVRRTRRSIDLPRAWVPLSHPAFVGKLRGSIEIAVRILTSEEARSFPVGKARDAPNQDPFLDPDDPHLVQHRSILSNTSFGRSFMKFVENLKSGFKIATIIFIIGCVIAGIVSIIVFLYSMGIIKINR